MPDALRHQLQDHNRDPSSGAAFVPGVPRPPPDDLRPQARALLVGRLAPGHAEVPCSYHHFGARRHQEVQEPRWMPGAASIRGDDHKRASVGEIRQWGRAGLTALPAHRREQQHRQAHQAPEDPPPREAVDPPMGVSKPPQRGPPPPTDPLPQHSARPLPDLLESALTAQREFLAGLCHT